MDGEAARLCCCLSYWCVNLTRLLFHVVLYLFIYFLFFIGGVTFTEGMITWRLPYQISPLLSSGSVTIIEFHMGIEGKRLDASAMAARNYKLTKTHSHLIVEIPVGSIDGYYKVCLAVALLPFLLECF